MTEETIEKPRFVIKKYLIADVLLFIIGSILLFINYVGIGYIIIALSILGILFIPLLNRTFSYMEKYNLPEPTRAQPEEPQTRGPKFTISSVWKNKKKLRGFLDGNTIFYKNHSRIAGSFDDRNPSNIELIYRGRVFKRIIGNIVQYAYDNRTLGNIHELELIPEGRGEPAKLKINESKNIGEIILTIPRGEEIIGIIEGEMEKMDNSRFYAILTFLFRWFC